MANINIIIISELYFSYKITFWDSAESQNPSVYNHVIPVVSLPADEAG